MTSQLKKILATYGKAPPTQIHPTYARKLADLKYLEPAMARHHMGNILKELDNNKDLSTTFVRTSLGVAIQMDVLWD